MRSQNSSSADSLDALVAQFLSLNVWQSKGSRAPHKPLLVLWFLGRCLSNKPRLVTYAAVDLQLRELLDRFGPHRKNIRTHYPFWRLLEDGFWEIDRPNLVRLTKSLDPYVQDLKQYSIKGGFRENVYLALRESPNVALGVGESLVSAHFPRSLHDEILAATVATAVMPDVVLSKSLDDYVTVRQRRRDSTFRQRVLEAYGFKCAICEFGVSLGDKPLALEAAHIKWHESDGPSEIRNGLSLCALHHRLFDTGAFTVLPELRIFTASNVIGHGVYDALNRFDGRPLSVLPADSANVPSPTYLDWHKREVFKRPDASLAGSN